MKKTDPPICPTHILEDEPSHKDLLTPSDEIGPHVRIAKAIAEIIINKGATPSKMIGLEGGWGSGKTTVIYLLEGILKKYTHITLYKFDAWAHEGNPLRRTFLESLIKHFQNVGWVKENEWDKIIERLAKRNKITKIRTTQSITGMGKWVGFWALMIPVGITLITIASTDGIVVPPCTNCRPDWLFLSGLILLLIPAISVAVYWSPNLFFIPMGHFKSEYKKKIIKLEFFEKESKSDSVQDTSETPEPTSIEFEEYFCDLIDESLDRAGKRQTVMVLDNLDRINKEDARSIWATLQTFLHGKPRKGTPWIIVPYDPDGIQHLWGIEPSSDHIDKEGKTRKAENGESRYLGEAARSFMEKSFQLRFEVPPLLLSNWKEYLIEQAGIAFPDHAKEEEDLKRIFDVYSLALPRGKAPTPRQIKLYINQIGVVHRQWQHTFPLDYIACYVLLKDKWGDVGERLLKGDPEIDNMASALGPDLKHNLAGMIFNVEAKLGMQLLLGDEIIHTLNNKEHEKLAKMESDHGKGFWAVLDDISGNRINEFQERDLVKMARCIYDSAIMNSESPSRSNFTINRLKYRINRVQEWSPFNVELPDDLDALCRLIKDKATSQVMVNAARRGVRQIDAAQTENRLEKGVMEGLLTLIGGIREIGHKDVLDKPFRLPGDADGWINLCIDFSKRDIDFWSIFEPKIGFADISNRIRDLIKSGGFGENMLEVLQITQQSALGTDWTDLAQAFRERLQADQNCSLPEVSNILRGIDLLKKYGTNCEDHLSHLANEGHFLHHLHQAIQTRDIEAIAKLVVRFFEKVPDGNVQSLPGNAGPGKDNLNTLLDGGDPDVAKHVVNILADEEQLDLLFAIRDKVANKPFLNQCLQSVAVSEYPEKLFTPDVILTRWREVQTVLDSGGDINFTTLIKTLSDHISLENDIMSVAEGFNYSNAPLYKTICSTMSKQKKKFKRWCLTGLRNIGNDIWQKELEGPGELFHLGFTLFNLGFEPELTQSYQDALESHALRILNENLTPSSWQLSKKAEIFLCSDSSLRESLKDRLVRKAVIDPNRTNKDFILLFGDEIANSGELRNRANDVAGWFVEFIRNRDENGLTWVVKVLNNSPDLFTKSEGEGNVKDFKQRVQSELSSKAEGADAIQSNIEEIAKILNIQTEVVEPEEGTEREEESNKTE